MGAVMTLEELKEFMDPRLEKILLKIDNVEKIHETNINRHATQIGELYELDRDHRTKVSAEIYEYKEETDRSIERFGVRIGAVEQKMATGEAMIVNIEAKVKEHLEDSKKKASSELAWIMALAMALIGPIAGIFVQKVLGG